MQESKQNPPPSLTPLQEKIVNALTEFRLTRLQERRDSAQHNSKPSTNKETSDSNKTPRNESTSESFKTISQVWEKAGLDFKRTTLMFTPIGNSPKELETDVAFKQMAREELEKEGIPKLAKEP